MSYEQLNPKQNSDDMIPNAVKCQVNMLTLCIYITNVKDGGVSQIVVKAMYDQPGYESYLRSVVCI